MNSFYLGSRDTRCSDTPVFWDEYLGSRFRYAIKDVQAIAPAGANAFSIGSIGMGGKGHVAGITWYRIEADTTRRLKTTGELYNDFELLMKVLGEK